MKYALIQSELEGLQAKHACQMIRVSASGFYAWQQLETIPKSGAAGEHLVAQINSILEESRRPMAVRA